MQRQRIWKAFHHWHDIFQADARAMRIARRIMARLVRRYMLRTWNTWLSTARQQRDLLAQAIPLMRPHPSCMLS